VTQPKTLVLILAGGAGGRLRLLTEQRAKPSVRFGARYRLIDFALSNCGNSQSTDVWLIQQHNPASLNDHLANGRPWDLDRTAGGLLTLPPHLGSDREGWGKGTADSIWRKAPLIREFDPDVFIVLSADAVYRYDYDELARGHRDSGAAVTMVTTQVTEDPSRYGVVETDGDRVTGYEYKPDRPASKVITTEVFAFSTKPTLDLLDEIAGSRTWRKGDRDLGHELLPRLVDDDAAREVRHEGYWQDVGTIDAYWNAHMELTADSPPFQLDDPQWPIRSADDPHGPAVVASSGQVAASLLGPGACIAGTVERSALGPGTLVEAGAVIRNSVLHDGVVVRSGAVIEHAIIDENTEIRTDARVGAAPTGGEAPAIAVVRGGTTVPPYTVIPAGEEWPGPPEEAD
jgi:glucose-1-phosphate adenylyltransferase